MDIEKLWEEKKELAKDGREFFVNLLKEYDIKEQDGIMVLLESDLEAARYLLQHGNELIQAGKYRRIYILTDSEKMLELAEKLCGHRDDRKNAAFFDDLECQNEVEARNLKDGMDSSWIGGRILCTTNQLENLIQLYQVYKFTNQIIWGTLKDIEDADGYQLEGYHGITKEDLIRTAIMDLGETE